MRRPLATCLLAVGVIAGLADSAAAADRLVGGPDERSAWTAGLAGRILRMPIGHGEGCYVADADTIAELEQSGRVVFRYTDAKGAATLESNPNGSTANIAGVTNEAGNVLGLMPHPERCVEALLGGTDGYQIIANVARTLAGTRPAIYR